VIALMIAPPAAAYLLTDRLSRMLLLSVAIAVASAISGYWVSRWLNVNISGAMASMTGVFFVLALVLAPERGLVARALQRVRRRRRFAVDMLLVHLIRHQNTDYEAVENTVSHLTTELNWTRPFAEAAVERAAQQGWIRRQADRLHLTDQGQQVVAQVLRR
jgi:manganese/zinc/iron transport system permease protein